MFSVNWFFLSSITLSITELFLIIILLKYGKEKIHRIWLLFNFSIFLWAYGSAVSIYFNFLSFTKIAILSWKISVFGVSFIPVFLLHSILLLTNQKYNKILGFCYIQAFISGILLLKTNLILFNSFQDYLGILIPPPGKFYFSWFILWTLIICFTNFLLFRYCYLKQKKDSRLLFFLMLLGCLSGTINFLYLYRPPLLHFSNFGIVIYSLVFSYAIFKHEMLGIKIAYKKGLLYSILLSILTGIYLLSIFIIEWLFRGLVGYHSIFVSLLLAFVIAVLFNPLKEKIQSFVDKIFLKKTAKEIILENEALKQGLERSERLKAASTLALGLAHEVKNPLSTIKIFTEYLSEKKNDEKFIEKFSKLIPQEVERINIIVRKLLDFSKPSPPDLKPSNICGTIREILELMSNDFLKRKIKTTEQSEDHDLIVNIDTGQIKQVLFNILLNAIDAMPEGGSIYVSAKSTNNKIEICIADEGVGISKENLKNIFNPFFTTKDEGTGLGLAICHNIIKNHNGTIEIESEENKGTNVRIKLPLTS